MIKIKQKTLISFIAIIVAMFFAPAFAAEPPTLVWQQKDTNSNQKIYRNRKVFTLDTEIDRILTMTFNSLYTGAIPSSNSIWRLSLINPQTGELVDYKEIHFPSPYHFFRNMSHGNAKLYYKENVTLYFHNIRSLMDAGWLSFFYAFFSPPLKIHLSADKFDIIPAYPDGHLLDTSIQGSVIIRGVGIKDRFYYSKTTNEVMLRRTNSDYSLYDDYENYDYVWTFTRVDLEESVPTRFTERKLDTIAQEDLLANIPDFDGKSILGFPEQFDIDDTLSYLVAHIVNTADIKPPRSIPFQGYLFMRFNRATGKFYSKKFIPEETITNLDLRNFSIEYRNNRFYSKIKRSGYNKYYQIREITLEGELLKSYNLYCNNSDMLKQYDADTLNYGKETLPTLLFNDTNSIYVCSHITKRGPNPWGGFGSPSTKMFPYKTYIAKYNIKGVAGTDVVGTDLVWEFEIDSSYISRCDDIFVKDKDIYLYCLKYTGENEDDIDRGKNIWLKFTETSSISEPKELFTSHIYPNPSTNQTTLNLELGSACEIKIILCDILGREVKQVYEGFAEAGKFTTNINTDNLAKSTYLLKISIGSEYKVEKFVVE